MYCTKSLEYSLQSNQIITIYCNQYTIVLINFIVNWVLESKRELIVQCMFFLRIKLDCKHIIFNSLSNCTTKKGDKNLIWLTVCRNWFKPESFIHLVLTYIGLCVYRTGPVGYNLAYSQQPTITKQMFEKDQTQGNPVHSLACPFHDCC